VEVDLYIAVPGTLPGSNVLVPLTVPPLSNKIQFTPTSNSEIKSLEWNPSAIAAMYPGHSSVFALAHPPDDCTVCPPQPTTTTPLTFQGITFEAVSANVLNSNKIAQRNLNF
jgi:hypothetical protein